MSHGINANVVTKWRRLAGAASLPVASFVPVALSAPTCTAPADIRIELRRGASGSGSGCGLRGLDARAAAVIRAEAVWLAIDPLDMRSGSINDAIACFDAFQFLKQDGVMAIILPHGVLFRGGSEARIRTKLLKTAISTR